MDEKRRMMSPLRGRPSRRGRHHIAMGLVALGLLVLYHVWPLYSSPGRWDTVEMPPPSPPVHNQERLVPFEAHIMSKCPDAKDCLREMILPTMQRAMDKVNFTLSYVGRPTDNDGVECKHGPAECMGNILELCAAKLYPDPKTYLGFTMCLTKDYEMIPQRSLIEDCALEHAVDFDKLNECAARDDGGYGVGLLRDSVQRTAEAGVTMSCTVRLDEKIYCIRDGGEWKDCPSGPGVNDLLVAIEKLRNS